MFTVEHAVAAVPPKTLRKEIQHDGKRNVLRHHNVLFRQRRVVGRAPQPQIAPNHLVPNGMEAVTRHRLLEERIPHRIAAQLVLQHTVRMNRAHEAVAVFALPDRVAHHEVKVVFFRQRDGGTVKIHRHKIVAVQKSEVLARRRIRAGHPRREKSAVLRMRQHPKAAVAPGILRQHRARAIRRGIIHQQELRVPQRLRAQRLQTRGQIPLRPIYRNDHRQRCSHRASPFCPSENE